MGEGEAAGLASSVSEEGVSQDAPEPDWSAVPLPQEEVAAAVQGLDMAASSSDIPTLTPEGFISYSAFHEGFCKAFELGGHIGQLQTLLNAPKQPSCPSATQAIYEIAVDTPALHFLIKPGSIWVQRAFAIGSFAVPVALGCAAEIRAKAAAKQMAEPLNKESLNKEEKGEDSNVNQ